MPFDGSAGDAPTLHLPDNGITDNCASALFFAFGAPEDAFQASFCYTCYMAEDEHITVTCQNCGEEITNSRAYFKKRDWECPHCGGSIISEDEQE